MHYILNPIPASCPLCGGNLVDLKCQREQCGKQWAEDTLKDGVAIAWVVGELLNPSAGDCAEE